MPLVRRRARRFDRRTEGDPDDGRRAECLSIEPNVHRPPSPVAQIGASRSSRTSARSAAVLALARRSSARVSRRFEFTTPPRRLFPPKGFEGGWCARSDPLRTTLRKCRWHRLRDRLRPAPHRWRSSGRPREAPSVRTPRPHGATAGSARRSTRQRQALRSVRSIGNVFTQTPRPHRSRRSSRHNRHRQHGDRGSVIGREAQHDLGAVLRSPRSMFCARTGRASPPSSKARTVQPRSRDPAGPTTSLRQQVVREDGGERETGTSAMPSSSETSPGYACALE